MATRSLFRNRRGELVEMDEIPASEVKSSFGEVLERVTATGGVVITRHQVPKAAVLSWEEFEALNRARTESLEALAGEFVDLLARLQRPAVKSALAGAFEATPAELGRSAVAAARRKRR